MTLHIFQSSETPELFGFTVDPAGANLPRGEGQWERAGHAIPLGVSMASTSAKISEQISRFGFALVKGHAASQPEVGRSETMP
jgi:hypothetical protein